MVLLTMSPSIVDGLQWVQKTKRKESTEESTKQNSEETDLDDPAIAKPISHAQILHLWHSLQSHPDADNYTLEKLLVGSTVYIPPPPPKPAKSPEYLALMARLRREEEARAYDRMVHPDPLAALSIHRPNSASSPDDDITFQDVHRQVMLILNFVLTMGGVAYTLWVLARWWPTPSRLFLSMAGSVLVGLAEWGLYAGYVWHLGEAKKKDQRKDKEVKRVVQTWVVEGSEKKAVNIGRKKDKSAPVQGLAEEAGVRRRKKETTQ